MKEDKLEYANSFRVQSENTDPFNGKTLVEPYPNGVYVVQNPPQEPLTRQEMDDIYDLPYERTYHPSYEALGGIPAIQEVQFSLASCRGCFGACSFCAITFHQGRIIQSRSHESIINEAKKIIDMPNFKGYIHDVGGPTANFYHPSCKKQLKSLENQIKEGDLGASIQSAATKVIYLNYPAPGFCLLQPKTK